MFLGGVGKPETLQTQEEHIQTPYQAPDLTLTIFVVILEYSRKTCPNTNLTSQGDGDGWVFIYNRNQTNL